MRQKTVRLSAVFCRRTELILVCLYCCVIFLCVITRCQSANHYCVNGHPVSLRIGCLYHTDETIIPEIPDEPIDKRGSYRQCSWEITVDEAWNQNSQIVLEGVNLETADLSESSNKTQVNILLNRSENVTLGMFQVNPLSQRKHISVQIIWDPKTQSRSPVNLRILIPDADLCSRDMLSFNGSCHAISTVPADITKAVERCIGDVSLASFTSMAHINEFIAANEARQNELPYKSPLDLSKWVRLGMFYRAGDGAILSVVRTKSGCELMEVDKNIFQVSQMHVNGPCGSLKVNETGKAMLQFGDCDEPMLALMSFRKTAKSAPDCSNCSNCSKHLLHKISRLHEVSKSSMASKSTSRFSKVTGNHENHESKLLLILVISGSAVNIVLFGIVAGVIIFYRRRKNFQRGQVSRSEKKGQICSPHVATHAKPDVKGQPMTDTCTCIMEDVEVKNTRDSGSPLLAHANPIFNS